MRGSPCRSSARRRISATHGAGLACKAVWAGSPDYEMDHGADSHPRWRCVLVDSYSVASTITHSSPKNHNLAFRVETAH
jgi:hypothetical protein